MVVEAHVCVLFGALFVAVDRDRGVLRASAVRFEQDHPGKEQHAGCVLRDVGKPGLSAAAPMQHR